MGAPVDTGLENFEEAILKLSVADRVKLIHWLAETVVSEEENLINSSETSQITEEPTSVWLPADVRIAENPSNKTPWYNDIPKAENLSEEERLKALDELSGAWDDHPMTTEELVEDIYSSRTISTKEIKLDD